MNIFKYEFKQYYKSIAIWSISILFLLYINMMFYPSLASDPDIVDAYLDSTDQALLDAFGMGGNLSFGSVIGYFGMTYLYIQMFLAIQASNYGFNILSIEERELTADFLFSKPVQRKQIFKSKFLAAITALTITNAIIWIGSILSILLFNGGNEYELSKVIIMLSTNTLFQLLFLTIGMVISMLLKKVDGVLSLSIALAIGMFLIQAVRNIVGGELFGFITPYAYFEPDEILYYGTYDLWYTLIALFIISGSIVMSYILYLKRNIRSL
ncbi:MAG: ABC transporter permease subunit [Candidatus Izemoplasma sp.]